MYPEARAFLQRPAAMALRKANMALKQYGFGIQVFDGYRPWEVTRHFWKITPPSKRDFVANPRKGSRHNRGCAVDVTLYHLDTKQPAEMPSDYDAFTKSAYPIYDGGTASQRANRDLLIEVMEKEGFSVYIFEWWHFDFNGWEDYPILDIPFTEIGTVQSQD
jgi:D-alanyl-D-alanine dipeptidase